MKLYIDNILPRLKQFSQDLDRKELFMDIPWITIDEQQNQNKYIFRRNGELIMSSNGQVTVGKWEYLSNARSLLIDRNIDKILLNQYFIDSAIMVLKLDGLNNNFILANEHIIPDFNVEDYLKKIYYLKNNVGFVELSDGKKFEIENYTGFLNKCKVSFNGENVPNGIFKNAKYQLKYYVEDSIVVKIVTDVPYKTDKGLLIVEQQNELDCSIGDNAYLNHEVAPDGKYKIVLFNYLYVLNGKITSKKIYNESIR